MTEPEIFRRAVGTLKSVRHRPEIELTEVRPPQRLAPWAYALTAEVTGPSDELSTGRLVLLHDPDGDEAWGGVLRVVAYVRVELDHELASDPLLPEVGWSWLTEALEQSGAGFTALGGTVTQTSSARFGDIFRGNAGKSGLLPALVEQDVAEQLWKLIEADPATPVTIDLEQRTISAGDLVAPFTIDAMDTPAGTLPQGGETRLVFPNRHLEYALTWYGLAGALADVFLVFSLSRRRRG